MLEPTVACRAWADSRPPSRSARAKRAVPQCSSVSTRVPSMSNRTARSDSVICSDCPWGTALVQGPRRAGESWGPSFVLCAVAKVRRQPLLGLVEGPALAAGVVLDLVPAEPPQHEVARLRVGEVQTADGRTGPHGHALGELHPGARLD